MTGSSGGWMLVNDGATPHHVARLAYCMTDHHVDGISHTHTHTHIRTHIHLTWIADESLLDLFWRPQSAQ